MGFMKRAAGSFDVGLREKLIGWGATRVATGKIDDQVYLAAILSELGRLNDNLEQLTDRQPVE